MATRRKRLTGRTEGEQTISKAVAALPVRAISTPTKKCKVDELMGVDKTAAYMSNASEVHDTITEMIIHGQSPRAIVQHLDKSGAWSTWKAADRISYGTIYKHAKECMGWRQALRHSMMEKALATRGETVETYVGSMVELMGAMEVMTHEALQRGVAGKFPPGNLTELINLCRFYLDLKSQLTGPGQEAHYLAEFSALGQAMTELIGPGPRHEVVLRAKEILRGRELVVQEDASMVEAVAEEIRELGIDPS